VPKAGMVGEFEAIGNHVGRGGLRSLWLAPFDCEGNRQRSTALEIRKTWNDEKNKINQTKGRKEDLVRLRVLSCKRNPRSGFTHSSDLTQLSRDAP